MDFPHFGFGAIVTEDPTLPFTRAKDFLQLLDICTEQLGIGYLDTAQGYMDGEAVLGKWVAKQTPDTLNKLKIGTKVTGRESRTESRQAINESYVVSTAQRSLAKLNLKTVDVFWLHSTDPSTPWVETLRGFHRLVQEGLAREVGMSNVSPSDIREFLKVCDREKLTRPKFIQNQFHLLYHKPELEVLKLCEQEGMHFTAFSPLAGGILTGKYTVDTFPAGTRWENWRTARGLPDFWNPSTFEAIEKVKKIAERKNLTLAELSLAWVANYPGMGTVLVGPRHEGQLAPLKKGLTLKLDKEEVLELAKLFV